MFVVKVKIDKLINLFKQKWTKHTKSEFQDHKQKHYAMSIYLISNLGRFVYPFNLKFQDECTKRLSEEFFQHANFKLCFCFNTNFFTIVSLPKQYKMSTWKFLITSNIKTNGFVIDYDYLCVSRNKITMDLKRSCLSQGQTFF